VTDDHLFIGNDLGDASIHPATGPPEGWATVGPVSPASFFIRGVAGALAQGFGLFSSIIVVRTSQDLDY